jgi:hypothetical protein
VPEFSGNDVREPIVANQQYAVAYIIRLIRDVEASTSAYTVSSGIVAHNAVPPCNARPHNFCDDPVGQSIQNILVECVREKTRSGLTCGCLTALRRLEGRTGAEALRFRGGIIGRISTLGWLDAVLTLTIFVSSIIRNRNKISKTRSCPKPAVSLLH